MDYDSAYHKLFSNPELVADLFQHFVTEDWVPNLDFSTLERINAKFHSDYLERREGDMIYRVQMQNSEEIVYLCILLEFQSTQNQWMAVRILAYIALFYQQLIKEKQLSPNQLLPPVFPLLLYNGDQHWHQPTQLRPFIDLPKGAKLWSYQPQMRYYLVDESRYPGGKSPTGKGDSLSGILFQLENVKTPEATVAVTGELIALLKDFPNAERLGHDFKLFIQHILKPATQMELPLEQMESLNEIHSMLSNRIEEWQKQWFRQGQTEGHQEGLKEGLKEGRQEGRQEGRHLGETQLLVRLLQQRFGDLPASAMERISNASEQELSAWSLKLLDAQSLDEVFE